MEEKLKTNKKDLISTKIFNEYSNEFKKLKTEAKNLNFETKEEEKEYKISKIVFLTLLNLFFTMGEEEKEEEMFKNEIDYIGCLFYFELLKQSSPKVYFRYEKKLLLMKEMFIQLFTELGYIEAIKFN